MTALLAGAPPAPGAVAAGAVTAGAVHEPVGETAPGVTPSSPGSASIAADLRASLATGPAAFWVRFDARPDLSAATQMTRSTARGASVYDSLVRTADTSQAQVRAYLDERDIEHQSFFITNAIFVPDGDSELAAELVAFDGVAELIAPVEYVLHEPVSSSKDAAAPNAVEWGVANINADDVWSSYGTGEGIVIASIDTGVEWDHPALIDHYRGTKADGTVKHRYNWFNSVGSNKYPYDNIGHGTHTMGTMIGDDGAGNQIGVAPGAKWITANGCSICSDTDLLQSGEWMLAPTRPNGTKPKPAKRPHIVNNSWGTGDPAVDDPFFDDIQEAWTASGIFGQWSIGNVGPQCGETSAPGNRPLSYAAGAYDINNMIASFSARGPGDEGEIKPNIAAPGVDVRSADLDGSYSSDSGTSMASPHVAGAVALLWSAVPALERDIAGTRAALDGSAIDKGTLACGGTTDDNNVFGEGRLDALALIEGALAAE